jgi:zinc/manganese transport system permease protein
MIELLGLYGWTLAAALTMAPALALIGAQLTARDQAIQVLVQSQASALGVVGGLALLITMGVDPHSDFALGPESSRVGLLAGLVFAGPLFGAIGFGALAFLGLERMIPNGVPSRSSYYVAAFSFLLAATFLITSLTPKLESHMATLYFGDLAVISQFESILAFVVGGIVTTLTALSWRSISDNSFQLALFGSIRRSPLGSSHQKMFLILTIVTIGFSIQTLGLLFTLSSLFIPTTLLARRGAGLIRHGFEVALIACAAADLGLILSLSFTSLPTAPCVVLCLVLLSFLLRTMGRSPFPES